MAVAGIVAQQFGLGFGLVDGPQLVVQGICPCRCWFRFGLNAVSFAQFSGSATAYLFVERFDGAVFFRLAQRGEIGSFLRPAVGIEEGCPQGQQHLRGPSCGGDFRSPRKAGAPVLLTADNP